jgi:hypothetical protein
VLSIDVSWLYWGLEVPFEIFNALGRGVGQEVVVVEGEGGVRTLLSKRLLATRVRYK